MISNEKDSRTYNEISAAERLKLQDAVLAALPLYPGRRKTMRQLRDEVAPDLLVADISRAMDDLYWTGRIDKDGNPSDPGKVV